MRAFSDNLSIVEYQYLVRMQNCTDSLCDNDHGRMFRLCLKRSAECRIGLHIQSGKTVIKHINLWIFCNCSGNGKPLLLSAGNIASALCNRTLIPILFAVNKLCCLRNLRCFPDLLI